MVNKRNLETYRKALAFMPERLFEKLCVKEIAEYCGVSASGIEKIFAQVEKVGVKKYFLNLKLEYATKMLREGDSVQHLATLLNFSSTPHLSMAFKTKYGVSPLKYKYSYLVEVNN